MLASYTMAKAGPLSQREFCERRANWLKANRPNVYGRKLV